MSTLRELGAQLRRRRQELDESQRETAAALGVTRQWLTRVEAGTGNPDLRQVFALCDHLGLRLTALLSGPPTVVAAKKTEPVNPRTPGKPGGKALGLGAHAVPDVDLDRLLAGFTGTSAGTRRSIEHRAVGQSVKAKTRNRPRG